MPPYRVWGSTLDAAIEFESLTTETLEPALKLIREQFFRDENVSKCVDLCTETGAADELLELCVQAAKDGVSVIAVDVLSNEVVGVAFNKIQVQGNPNEPSAFEEFSKRCKYKSSRALVDFMIDVDSRFNLFDYYDVDCILEIMFLVTAKAYRRRRIGELLIATSVEIGRELVQGKDVKIPVTVGSSSTLTNEKSVPSLCSLIGTSIYTTKIAEKFGFSQHATVNFSEFKYNGKLFSDIVGPTSAVLAAKKLV